MVTDASLGCQIVSFDFSILLDYLFIFKVTGFTELNGHISLRYQLFSHHEKQMQCWLGHQI